MNEKINALTSLRFFAAFAVVIFHMADYSPEHLHWDRLEKAHLAVDLFFILSGFILAHVYGVVFSEKKGSTRVFLISRLARIYPAHLAMMIVFLLYFLIIFSAGIPYNAERYRPNSFLWHITLLGASGLDRGLSWNFPAWSISAEFCAYLMFPFIIRPCMRLTPRFAAFLLFALIGIFALLNGPLRLTERTYDFSVIRVLPEFLMGVLAYRSRAYLITYAGNANIAFGCTLAILVALIWAMAPDAFFVAAFVSLIVLGAALTGSLAAILAWRPLVYLGEASYSLYLVHAFVLSVLYNAFKISSIGHLVPTVFRDWLVLVAVLLAASMLYHFVEKPSRTLIRKALAERTAVSGMPTAARKAVKL